MFTIIIPLFNKQESIQITLKSVINQTLSDFEVFIVDDESKDNSYLEAQKMAISDSRIHLINKENGGVSSARNTGIRQAKWDFIAFLDADDTWEPNYLFEQAKLISDFPEAYMWGLSWHNVNHKNKQPQKHNIPDDFRGIPLNYWESELHLFWTSAVVVRKTVFEEIGHFDERMTCGEDLDMWLRIILNYRVAFCNKSLANYVLDAENRAMNREIPLEKHLPYFIEKYAEYRKNNREFRKYFDKECLYRLFPYMLQVNNHKEDVKKILGHIDFSEHKLSFRLRFMFPRLYNWYSNLRGNDNLSYFNPA